MISVIAQPTNGWLDLVWQFFPFLVVVTVGVGSLVHALVTRMRKRRQRQPGLFDGESAPERSDVPSAQGRTPVWVIVFWIVFVPAGLTLVAVTVFELLRA